MRASLRDIGGIMLTQQQARALANFVTLLRPEWNADGIYAALGRCKDRDPYATALATIRAAWDDGAKTPGVIPTDGPHWREMAGEVPKSAPRSYNIPCSEHSDHQLPCRLCAAKRVPAEEPTAAALARAALTDSLAQLCPHGVKRGLVKCGECERPDRDVPAAEVPDHPATPPDHDTAPSAEEEPTK